MVLALVLTAPFSFCQSGFHDPSLESKTVEGRIIAVDLTRPVIEVSMVSYHDQITISVPYSAKIYKAGKPVELKDAREGDSVVVNYYNDSPNPLKVISMTIK